MPEKQTLGRISAITDCDTGLYAIGEIDGGLELEMTRHHIKKYGSDGLLRQLAYMTHTVIETQREINQQGQQGEQAALNPGVELPPLNGDEKSVEGVSEPHLKSVT